MEGRGSVCEILTHARVITSFIANIYWIKCFNSPIAQITGWDCYFCFQWVLEEKSTHTIQRGRTKSIQQTIYREGILYYLPCISPLLLGVTATQLNFSPLMHVFLKCQWRCPTQDAYDPRKVRFLLEILNGLTQVQESGGSQVIQMEAPWRVCT